MTVAQLQIVSNFRTTTLKMAGSLVAAPCSLVEVYRRFQGACCLHHQGDEMVMEAARAYEMSINFYQTTRSNNPKDSHIHTFRCKNVKSQ
jgi:hypothetical protein